MFGLIVAGRLVKSDFQQLEDTKFVISVEDADTANHIVVFMTGTIPFPEGSGGAVHFCWPGSGGYQTWQYLGCISNEKPSAVFKISGLKSAGSSIEKSLFAQSTLPHTCAQIGISVETILELAGMSACVQAEPLIDSGAVTLERLASRTARHLVNYVASFARSQGSETYVPLSTLQSWHELFLRKIRQDPKSIMNS